MEKKTCELCGKNQAVDMRFGVLLCADCLEAFSQAAMGNAQQQARLSDPRNFPNASQNAYYNIILNMARRTGRTQQTRQETTAQPAAPTIAQRQQRMHEEGYTAVAKEGLYADIGGKIKSWAKWIFIIGAVSAIFSAIAMMASAEDGVVFVAGLLALVLGPIAAYVSSWILYAYGEMVEKTVKNEENTHKILELLREKNK